ncbi:MAG TPA: SDR family NAD(P)-dependent oxidoreductase [Polyangiales bacterium]|nr:SDR family NAD(P)-dependent oxidoreductase [Polyangiales bacterium]
MRYTDKIVIVTGAASGIGRASALRLASEGASVACLDVDAAALADTAKQIADGRGLAIPCDVSQEAAVQGAIEQVLARFGRIDVLCNIAGILRSDRSHELSLENWNRVLGVNLTGTFLMCRAALPHLLATRGAIVNMSSTAALGSHPWMAAYAASKGGILSLTRALAVEYVKQGLRVNAICPGGVKTPIHNTLRLPKDVDYELLKRALPYNGFAEPEEVASVVAFLGSADASYLNGIEIRVDGGALS